MYYRCFEKYPCLILNKPRTYTYMYNYMMMISVCNMSTWVSWHGTNKQTSKHLLFAYLIIHIRRMTWVCCCRREYPSTAIYLVWHWPWLTIVRIYWHKSSTHVPVIRVYLFYIHVISTNNNYRVENMCIDVCIHVQCVVTLLSRLALRLYSSSYNNESKYSTVQYSSGSVLRP